MKTASEFFAMGGYGLYVWGSYWMAVACLATEVWLLRQRRAALMKHLTTRRGSKAR